MIKPNPLKPGSRVALVAPSSPVGEEKLSLSLESIRFLGFTPVLYPSCTMQNGYLAGTDKARAKDINDAFSNAEIDGVFCLRGGYGAMRILPLLNYDLIKSNPKVFVGYSDITALHTVINELCGFITFHAPMPTAGYHTMDYFSLESLSDAIFGSKLGGRVFNPPDEPLISLCPGKAKGIMAGGNLSVLASTLGSPYEINTKGKILFIEDVDERPYRIDKSLTALDLAGKLDDCEGIVSGTFSNCEEKELEPSMTLTLSQILKQVIGQKKKPALHNFRAGHIYPQSTIPMGAKTYLDADNGILRFME